MSTGTATTRRRSGSGRPSPPPPQRCFALGLGITTPPRSGSNCSSECITAPYTDAAAFVPRDDLWVYAASVTVLVFVVLVACVHHAVAPSHRVFSQVALSFAVIAAAAAVLDYAVQLAVLQPALLRGELDGVSLWSMYNPHGAFIAFENTADLLMAVSFVFLAASLPKVGGVVRGARRPGRCGRGRGGLVGGAGRPVRPRPRLPVRGTCHRRGLARAHRRRHPARRRLPQGRHRSRMGPTVGRTSGTTGGITLAIEPTTAIHSVTSVSASAVTG